MRIVLFWLFLIGGAVTQAASSPGPAPAAAPVSAAVPKQWPGYYEGSNAFRTEVARTQSEWEGLWSAVRKKPPQALTVATEMGVAIHIGERPHGGHEVQVLKAYVEDGKFVVEFKERTAGRNEAVLTVVTHPWAIAVVPCSALPVIFRQK